MFGFENFLHTPVKYYSSGMYMRLAFALIAHVDADIYLLDEVLSVGDLSFRDKVLNMISKMSSKGKTVLIVTHVPDTIYAYCEKIAILNKGELIEFDKPGKCIAKYNSLAFQNSGKIIKTHNSNPKDSLVAINPNFLSYINLTEANVDISGEIVAFKIHFEVLLKQKIQIRIIIKDELNKPTIEILPDQDIKTTGKFCQKTTLPENLLNPFYYFIDLHIYIDNKIAGVFSKIIGFRYQENISQEKTCLFKFHNAKTEIISLPE
ncbi:MAG: hypothetical protein C0596_12665 [Marinilabiliales bacterium]|nr:MAG: hypothetical protein C0596_12665 [Marinilabiliales bacterium]